MHKFTDTQGRQYTCMVSAQTAINLKKLHGINLMEHFDGSLWTRLAEDPELLINVLAEIVKESIDNNGIDEQTFARSLGGDCLDEAITAMRGAITDFSPPRQRAALKALMDKSDQVQSLAIQKVMSAIDKLTPEALLKAMDTIGREQTTSSGSASS